MIDIREAPYCREESKRAGTNDAQYKAGLRLVELAVEGDANVEFMVIEATKHDLYFPWVRMKARKGTVRAIAEVVSSSEIVIHLILARDTHTYDDVEALWKQYRRQRPVSGQ